MLQVIVTTTRNAVVKICTKAWPLAALGCLVVWLASCASSPNARVLITDAPEPIPRIGDAPQPRESVRPTSPEPRQYPSEATRPGRLSQVYPGTGAFISEERIVRAQAEIGETEDVTLNFESADVREVVAMILGEILKENYVVDPNVKGSISLRTSRPMDRSALLSILEAVLQVNNAALIHRDGLFKVVPTAKALQGVDAPRLGTLSGRPGYQVRLIPLQYVAAQEMHKILEPFIAKEGVLRVDSNRNLLIVAGSAAEIAQVGEMVELFDVDWLQGMSFGLLPIHYTDPETIVREIEAMFSEQEDGPLGGLVRLVPVQRLNALMVISSQPRYLREVQKWLARLDVPGEGEGRRLYVFRVQNGRAEDLAGILRELFGLQGEDRRQAEQAPELAPGATPRLVQLRPGDEQSAGADSPAADVIERQPAPRAPSPTPEAATSQPSAAVEPTVVGRVNIVADRSRNALLILATPNDYAKLESALFELDVPPLQVLIEATIVDVNLSGELSHGVQWFFDHRLPANTLTDHRYDFIGSATIGLPLAFPGTLSYQIVNAAQEVRALMNLLATEDKIKVIASPSVLVLDNESATIRVGDQQPISTTVVTEGGVVSSSVQFKDTGVTLQVTPRVNAGGLVILDISQELSDAGAIDDATGQRAFLERSVQSRVALRSGESVVLGGLISENNTRSESGVPFIHKLPVIGFFFGQKVNTVARTELVVVLNATVIENRDDLREVTKEFRRKMRSIYPQTGADDSAIPLQSQPDNSTIPPPAAPQDRPDAGQRTLRQAPGLESRPPALERTLDAPAATDIADHGMPEPYRADGLESAVAVAHTELANAVHDGQILSDKDPVSTDGARIPSPALASLVQTDATYRQNIRRSNDNRAHSRRLFPKDAHSEPTTQEIASAYSEDLVIVVEKGDTLSNLAKHYLGREFYYYKILEANSNTVENPHVIKPGMQLRIPTKR